MKTKILSLLCFLLLSVPCLAQNHVTASITVTNITTNGMTFTVNGNTRTWTNNVVTASSQVLTNADATGAGSKTNLFNHIALNPFSLVSPPQDTGSNTFSLVAVSTNALVVTASAGYASVSYSTQTVSSAVAVRIPTTIEAAAVQTNIDSGLVAAINSPKNTNSIDQTATVASQLVGLANAQTITGQKILNNTNNAISGVITSIAISGNSVLLTNGVYFTPFMSSPTFTNGVNYGNAFSSPGSGTLSEQIGNGSLATNIVSLAVGASALAYGDTSTSIGASATSYTNLCTAVGADTIANGAQASSFGALAEAIGDNSTSIGADSFANAASATAIGNTAISSFQNSTAVGAFAITTASNQVMLGAPGSSTVVPNNLSVKTNETIGGNLSVAGNISVGGIETNAFITGSVTVSNADIAFPRKAITSLANGNNEISVGANQFIEVSGPTGAFSLNGIANGRDGKWISVLNQTAQPMTIVNESGLASTSANRIRTLANNDLILNGNSLAYFWYNANVSRWIYGGSSGQPILASLTTVTNPIVDGGYWTNTTGYSGMLTVNIHTAVNGSSNPSMCLTNFGNGEWFNATNDSAGGTIDMYFKTALRVAPGDYIEATNHSSSTATALIQASWFRP